MQTMVAERYWVQHAAGGQRRSKEQNPDPGKGSLAGQGARAQRSEMKARNIKVGSRGEED